MGKEKNLICQWLSKERINGNVGKESPPIVLETSSKVYYLKNNISFWNCRKTENDGKKAKRDKGRRV